MCDQKKKEKAAIKGGDKNGNLCMEMLVGDGELGIVIFILFLC
jgi:hypothetical protein